MSLPILLSVTVLAGGQAGMDRAGGPKALLLQQQEGGAAGSLLVLTGLQGQCLDARGQDLMGRDRVP